MVGVVVFPIEIVPFLGDMLVEEEGGPPMKLFSLEAFDMDFTVSYCRVPDIKRPEFFDPD